MHKRARRSLDDIPWNLPLLTPSPWGLLHPSGGTPFFRAGAAGRAGGPEATTTRGLMLYSTLLEFWLTDGDEPVPLASSGDFASKTPPAPAAAPMWWVFALGWAVGGADL